MTLQRTRFTLLVLVLLVVWPMAVQSSAGPSGDQILGRWLFPAKGSSVEIYRSGNQYFGRMADVSTTGKQQFGVTKNQLLMSNLSFDGQSWSGGELIHPRTGNRFGVELNLEDPRTLRVKVYKGFKWIHKEFTLTRPS